MTTGSRRPASAAQLTVLHALARQSPMSVTGLVERTGISAPWLARSIRVLAERGLASRKASSPDARRAEISLTAKGRAFLERRS
jgi:DNA-binding MarR family transcriptional regulator